MENLLKICRTLQQYKQDKQFHDYINSSIYLKVLDGNTPFHLDYKCPCYPFIVSKYSVCTGYFGLMFFRPFALAKGFA